MAEVISRRRHLRMKRKDQIFFSLLPWGVGTMSHGCLFCLSVQFFHVLPLLHWPHIYGYSRQTSLVSSFLPIQPWFPFFVCHTLLPTTLLLVASRRPFVVPGHLILLPTTSLFRCVIIPIPSLRHAVVFFSCQCPPRINTGWHHSDVKHLYFLLDRANERFKCWAFSGWSKMVCRNLISNDLPQQEAVVRRMFNM